MVKSGYRRIGLNVAATYGRSLVALVCGLLAGRWVLMALGVVDYGIFGLVGGLVAFVTFFNGVLAGVVARFYAFSVGREDVAECQRWFSTAVSVHMIIPAVLMAVGYPLGTYAIAHWLVIPPERVVDAIWVWRFVCIGSWVMMVHVPFNAMFVAKQRFLEISLYGSAAAVVNVGVLGYMVAHPGQWLVRLSAWSCLLTVLSALVVIVRATMAFEECRLVRRHLWNGQDIRELVNFVGWMSLGGLGLMLREAGMKVLVNKIFGPARNAALAVATSASDHASSLTGSVLSAFQPAITSAYGAGNVLRMVTLSNVACKLCVLSLLPFVIPLALEIDEILALWLKVPPDGARSLCVWIMVAAVIDRMTSGLWAALEASGRIAVWQSVGCVVKVGGLVSAGVFALWGVGMHAVGVALVLIAFFDSASHLVLTWQQLGFSPTRWLRRIAMPTLVVAVAATAAGALPQLWMERSFLRVCVTTVVADLTLVSVGWFFLLENAERRSALDWIRIKVLGK